jgi:hypothetical protein
MVRFIVFSMLLGLFIGSVSAAWHFEPNGYNLENISNDTETVFLTDLVENSTGEELSPDDISNFTVEEGGDGPNTYVKYEYDWLNQSSGNITTVNRTLSYHERLGTWYANFSPNNANMSNISFIARGESVVSGHENSEGEVSRTVNADVSDIDVDLLTELDDPIKADKEVKIDVRAMNISNGQALNDDDVNVSVYFHNTSVNKQEFGLDNYNDNQLDNGGQYHYNSEVRTPPETNRSFIFRVVAESENSTGSESMLIDTAPAIQGNIASLSSDGCGEEQVASGCDPGAEINTEFDITEAGAEGVNLTLYKRNSSSGEWMNHTTVEMNEISASEDVLQTFEKNMTLPDLNTSIYDKKYRLNYHAWNQDRKYEENHTVDLRSFVIEDRSNPTAFKSREHTIRLFLGERFSRNSLNKSRFEVLNVTLEGPENEYNESYTVNDFEYLENDGTMVNTVIIPGEELTGAYELDIMVRNNFKEVKEITRGLKVRDVNATFSAQEELDVKYTSTGLFNDTINIENLVDSEKTLDVVNDNENLSMADEVTIDANGDTDFEVEINVTEPGSFESDIEFADSSARYNETTSVTVQGPDCDLRDGDLCVNRDAIDLETEDSETLTESLGLSNLGEDDLNLTMSFTGNASERFSTQDNISVEAYEEVDVEFDATTAGYYEGELQVESNSSEQVSVNLTGLANLTGQTQAGLTASPSSIEIGSVGEGEAYSTELTVENTGDVDVNQITADTGGLDINISEFSLSPGGEESWDLTIPNPQSTSIQFTGDSSEGQVTLRVNVNADVIEDYSERTDELRNRMNNLRSRTNDTQLESDLSEVSGMITQVETQWDRGDYQEAQDTFEQAQSTLDSVQQSINSQQTDTGGEDPQNGSDQTEGGGGLPIIPIIGVLFVLLLVGGVVFYESYIPEEGDPLYGVLGE